MSDRLLRINEVAALLGTGPGKAEAFLRKQGIKPVNFGSGRGGGDRWLLSALEQVMRMAFQTAQPKPRKESPRKALLLDSKSIGEMTPKELYSRLQKNRTLTESPVTQ